MGSFNKSDQLPHPTMAPRRETTAFLVALNPDVRAIDSGRRQGQEIDRQWHADFTKAHGPRPMRSMGLNPMEADWVITAPGLLYVNSTLRYVWGWRWHGTAFEVVKRGRRFAAIDITDQNGQRYVMQLGVHAMDNVLAAAALAESD